MGLPLGRESGRSHRESETRDERVCQRKDVLRKSKAIAKFEVGALPYVLECLTWHTGSRNIALS